MTQKVFKEKCLTLIWESRAVNLAGKVNQKYHQQENKAKRKGKNIEDWIKRDVRKSQFREKPKFLALVAQADTERGWDRTIESLTPFQNLCRLEYIAWGGDEINKREYQEALNKINVV